MDVKAGGGQTMTLGDILKAFLTKLEWFSTLFPRIPVPIQVRSLNFLCGIKFCESPHWETMVSVVQLVSTSFIMRVVMSFSPN